jgi:hypothetical protein
MRERVAQWNRGHRRLSRLILSVEFLVLLIAAEFAAQQWGPLWWLFVGVCLVVLSVMGIRRWRRDRQWGAFGQKRTETYETKSQVRGPPT